MSSVTPLKAFSNDVMEPTAYRPNVVISTERSIPSPIWVAALIGVEKILRRDFDLSQLLATYLHQAPAQIPENTPGFGRPIGLTVNYAPDHSIRYDLTGKVLAVLSEAVRPGQASISIPLKF